MRRTKSTARRSYWVVASSSSSEDDISLDANQEEAPASFIDDASSSMVSQRNQFTCKYETQWKDDLLMQVCFGFSFFLIITYL
jgi:hypothetical protein